MMSYANALRFIRYGLVGACGTLVQYAILVALVMTHVTTPVVASTLGAVAGAVINYFLNAKFTFNHTSHAKALPKFAATAILGASLNALFMYVQTAQFGINYLIAQVVATVMVLVLTYVINSIWTFRPETRRAPAEDVAS